MVSISNINSAAQTQSVSNTAKTVVATTTAVKTTTAPTISTTNSSTVKVSSAALTVAKAPTVATPMSVAQILAAGANIPANTVIKDTAANISTNLKALGALTTFSFVSSITLSDTKAGTISIVRTDIAGDFSDPQNTDPNLAVLKKITSSYTLNVSDLSVSDALTLKSPAKTATLSLSISDTVDNIAASLTALQTAAKAKSIAGIAIPPATAGAAKANLSITAAQLKASPELLATIKGDYDLTITGVLAADAVTAAGNADKVLKASGSGSTQSKVAISDTSANLVKSIAALETAATAGRLTSITVSDGKALVLTEAQIKADSHFLATQFTSNTTVEATAVAAADVLTVQSLVNANGKLSLTKESIADTAANIQSNLDNLEAAVKAPTLSSASNAFTIANIGITDKGSITVANSTLVNDIDALKVLTGKYTLNVTDIGVSDALALKAPSKDATLAISVKDTAANIAANWDKLQAAVKAKTITAITVTDSTSSLLSISAAQLKSDADALKLVTGDYKLSVTGVSAADVAKTLTAKNMYSVEVKDSVANILKNLPSIQTAVTAAKIQNVVITDATNPSLSITDIFALTTTLPNVTLAAGVKFNVKDTANMIIAHSRDDIGDVLKNAGTVTLTDKTPPNLTLADAITLKGIANLTAGTKYNVTDGGAVIAAQAALAGETVLSGAASVTINKNFTIADAKAVTGIKTLAKGTVYSITDTADNILAQSGVSGEKILAGANTVTVVDTSAKIIARLDQLEVLAKAGKIADIKFTDTPSAALDITQDQLVKDAEAIGKIISQRTLPTLMITKPTTPPKFGKITVLPISTPTTLNNSIQITTVSSDGKTMYGQFTTDTGSTHFFKATQNIIKTQKNFPLLLDINIASSQSDTLQGWNFIDLTPNAKTITFDLINQNKNIIYGKYTNEDGSQGFYAIGSEGQFTQYNITNSQIKGFSEDGTKFWGKYINSNGQENCFIADFNGNLKNITQGYNESDIYKTTSDGNLFWGTFGSGNNDHAFICDSNGNLKDLTPNAKNANLSGSSQDGSSIFGAYHTESGPWTAFYADKFGKYIEINQINSSICYASKDSNGAVNISGYFTNSLGYNHAYFYDEINGFKDIVPDSKDAVILGSSPDNSTIWGRYTLKDNSVHLFQFNKIKGFVDCTPNVENIGNINASKDGSILFGSFDTGTNPTRIHAFIFDSQSGFSAVNVPSAIDSSLNGISNDNSLLWGNYYNPSENIFMIKNNSSIQLITIPNSSSNSIIACSNTGNFVLGTSNINKGSFFVATDQGNITSFADNVSIYDPTGIMGHSNDSSIFWVFSNDSTTGSVNSYIISENGKITNVLSNNSQIVGISENNSVLYGFTRDSNGEPRAALFNKDGSVVDVSPSGSVFSEIKGISPDGTKIWGTYTDINQTLHNFIYSVSLN
jgi:hypothetical protein